LLITKYNFHRWVDKIKVVNELADQEDFDEIKLIMEVFRVSQMIKKLTSED